MQDPTDFRGCAQVYLLKRLLKVTESAIKTYRATDQQFTVGKMFKMLE